MKLSYAQNLEGYHLSLAFPGQKTGTYIDMGGGHPIADNVSFWFYERGWRGLLGSGFSIIGLRPMISPRNDHAYESNFEITALDSAFPRREVCHVEGQSNRMDDFVRHRRAARHRRVVRRPGTR
jgi:hypothetical protein